MSPNPKHILAQFLADKAAILKDSVDLEPKRDNRLFKSRFSTEKQRSLRDDLQQEEWKEFEVLRMYYELRQRAGFLEVGEVACTVAEKSRFDFPDVYAQTVAYGLLVARWIAKDNLVPFNKENIARLLSSTSAFNLFVKTSASEEIGDCYFQRCMGFGNIKTDC